MVDVIAPKIFRDYRTCKGPDSWSSAKLMGPSTITTFIVGQVASEREKDNVIVGHDMSEPCGVDRAQGIDETTTAFELFV